MAGAFQNCGRHQKNVQCDNSRFARSGGKALQRACSSHRLTHELWQLAASVDDNARFKVSRGEAT